MLCIKPTKTDLEKVHTIFMHKINSKWNVVQDDFSLLLKQWVLKSSRCFAKALLVWKKLWNLGVPFVSKGEPPNQKIWTLCRKSHVRKRWVSLYPGDLSFSCLSVFWKFFQWRTLCTANQLTKKPFFWNLWWSKHQLSKHTFSFFLFFLTHFFCRGFLSLMMSSYF